MTDECAVGMTIDGNEAAAYIAHQLNEIIAIYPITPASPMGEHADEWSAAGRPNLWGAVPEVIEMQSEAGAAGAVHGALQAGALTTTFTASQGLMLMLPNMYKIAGELTPTVFHVASRTVASHALSIFGDHSDVMAARSTGFALLAASSVQEVMDFALIAQIATLRGRIPVLHFFDGFRTSHEINKIEPLSADMLRALVPVDAIGAHRARALSPEHPVLRGSSQNPDVFFQARETVNRYYDDFPAIVSDAMRQLGERTGRRYQLFDYVGHAEAERVLVTMGSGSATAHETVKHLQARGERVGLVKVRLFRPFSPQALLAALPPTVRRMAVLDRCKEPGADGEPLYKDVQTAVARHAERFAQRITVTGGRYGLASKEFTPGMAKAVLDELKKTEPQHPFTIGINDDVTHLSLDWDRRFRTDVHLQTYQAVFYGLGSDGTVSANKNSIKIIGEQTDLHAQGYFVYDSRKAGAVTISHLRFGPDPIHAAYLIEDDDADFVACHQSSFLPRYRMLDKAAEGGIFLLNTVTPAARVWAQLPAAMQRQIIDKKLRFYAIDAYRIAESNGLGRRINTVMQTCFFALSEILPRQQAVAAIKQGIEKSYHRAGQTIIEANFRAVDETLASLHAIAVPDEAPAEAAGDAHEPAGELPEFVRTVTLPLLREEGDRLPVSALPSDGTFPVGTAAFEKRNLAPEIPIFEPDICTQCGKCPFVCPHAAIRSKVFPPEWLERAPAGFRAAPVRGKDYPEGWYMSYQVAPEDCTGCTLCVDICPIRDKEKPGRKALNMVPHAQFLQQERENWAFFRQLPEYDRTRVKVTTIPQSMHLQPLFEFSSACVGCGETSYIRLATQLFGDRMIVANATGCSSIYGGNLPVTPWTKTREGRGPAWNNSLFEDNAEFGFGIRAAVDQKHAHAVALLKRLAPVLGEALVEAILQADEHSEAGIFEQRERVAQAMAKLEKETTPEARALRELSDYLCRKSVWIIGGDGWAYDIGFGGLDHVLASGRDVNVLVLDTEVYSNTGGQTSKATPRGAVAKFSSAGKPTAKKDLARFAIDYGNVYVAQVAYGARDVHTLRAFLEAESYPGPSLIIAYSPCIEHGVDLAHNHRQQRLAVDSGHWPLFRYDPRRAEQGKNPFRLDSKPPSVPFRDYALTERRFAALMRSQPQRAEELLRQSQQDVEREFRHYQRLAEGDCE